jgi:hypothetical protein
MAGEVVSMVDETGRLVARFHHATHRQLLTGRPAKDASRGRVDAVIVPAARPVEWLREAMKLAGELGTGVVAMCSKGVTAAEAANLGDELEVPVVAMDPSGQAADLPSFSSTRLLEKAGFLPPGDTSVKRNLALYLTRLAGWERVLFLDDDICGVDPRDAQAAAGLLDEFEVVGLSNEGYPDNSVVCHVLRELGGGQAQFIGAGAMAVAPQSGSSFFPEVFNEDWLYVLGTGDPPRVAVTGQMEQKSHDPFANSDRARQEEFGDCLAEGLFWLLDNECSIRHADEEHWQRFLGLRGYFIGHLNTEVATSDLDPTVAKSFQASLNTAWDRWMEITATLCAEYVRKWRVDLATWRSFIRRHPVGSGLDAALRHTGWSGVRRSTVPWPEGSGNGAVAEDPLRFPGGWERPAARAEPDGAVGRLAEPSRHTSAPA